MNLQSKIKKWKLSQYLINKNYRFNRGIILKNFPNNIVGKAYNSISKWKGYSQTPLIRLNKLSKELKVNNIFYKDESKRFNLKSFKALGGAYAVKEISKKNKNVIISSATAGNHGRSVAWGAQRLGLKSKIFISQNVSESRANSIRELGAEVIRVKGNYENSLKQCLKKSKKNNWKVVQDVSTKNYSYIPKLTMAGYSIMIKEISKQTNKYITHVFLQAGVGGMAAGVVAGIAKYFKRIPKIIIVEPKNAACVLESIEKQKMTKIKIKKESIMGGMSCNEMSLIPWKILRNATNCCLTVSDNKIPETVAMLAKKSFSDKKIIGGECSAPGAISLISLCNNKSLREKIKLNSDSNILLIGCEGDVDKSLYNKLLNIGVKKLKR